MEQRMIRFPSIEQSRRVLSVIAHTAPFSNVVDGTPYYGTAALPALKFCGTVKLHGSNAAVVQTHSPSAPGSARGGGGARAIHFQSRERILSLENDLMGFCAHMASKMHALETLFGTVSRSISPGPKSSGGSDIERHVVAIAVFGEWCGMGIQKGVALSNLPKMFVIFGIQVLYAPNVSSTSSTAAEPESEWIDLAPLSAALKNEPAQIFNIMQFPTYNIEIDFSSEESILAGTKAMEELTLKVEQECPVGKHFGVSGVGEGIVWRSPQGGQFGTSRFWFKTKGVKHASCKKPKSTRATADNSVDSGKSATLDAFVELVVTEGRLQQGLHVLEREMLLPLEMKSAGAFIKWVHGDVLKEEDDRIEQAGLNRKVLAGPICATAKKWYVERLLDENLKTLSVG